MGSGTNRKASDSPIIRAPKQKVATGGGGVGGGHEGSSEKAANVCIPSFEVLLENNPILHEKLNVSIQKVGAEIYGIFLLGKKVGEINKRLSKMVDVCDEIGVSYSGVIVKVRDKFYARFIRK